MLNKFNCLIVDDEQDAVELLGIRIKHLFDNIEVAGECYNWSEAFQALKNNKYDLVFMDISMPGKSGIDLLKLLPNLESEIIFITAHEEYAIEAFSFSASGYILKPVADESLYASVNKALVRIEHKRGAQAAKPVSSLKTNKIGIPNNHGIDYVNVNDILYLESTNKCTRIITDKTVYTSTSHMGKLRESIPDDFFFQIHRSFIINLNCILRYESSGLVIMTNKTEIPVSRSVKSDFLRIFNTNL